MRNKNIINANLYFLTVLILLVSIFSYLVVAEDNSLYILITNLNDELKDTIDENTYFKISAYTESESFLSDVIVEFDGNEYVITEENDSELIILASGVDTDTIYMIKASKEGYITAYNNITVKNLDIYELYITPTQDYVVDAGDRFSVKVTKNNASGVPIKDAIVAIQNVMGSETTTNSNGIAYLTAPENKEEITIRASKDGYIDGTLSMEINMSPSVIDQLLSNEYLIFFIAILILISAIAFVHFREKKYEYFKSDDFSDTDSNTKKAAEDLPHKKDDFYGFSSENVKFPKDKNSKVEEIRIVQKRSRSDTIAVDKDKKEEIITDRKIEDEDDWFKGTDEVRYEIDRLTGEIDEEGKDKWFEGVENIREKLDEKMKKKDKKKKEED